VPQAAPLFTYEHVRIRDEPLDLLDELASLAERRNVSMAQLIREAILSFISREAQAPDGDPLLDIVGMIDSPDVPIDAAENHDRYIYRKDWED